MGSHTRKVRRAVDYENNVPRCETCCQYVPRKVVIVDQQPYYREPWCTLNEFSCGPNGICRLWRDHKGATLQTANA